MLQLLFQLILLYLGLGFVFALGFVAVGYKKIDVSAEGTGIRLRLIWMPGAIAVWPVLAKKWLQAKSTNENS